MLGYHCIRDHDVPPKRSDRNRAYLKLYRLNARGIGSVEELDLPDNADWMDIKFRWSPEKPMCVEERICERVRDCLKVPSVYLQSLSDPRYRIPTIVLDSTRRQARN